MRKCSLDLAPEAPWECPDPCPSFERRMADVNWRHGTLVTPPTPEAPESVGDDPTVGALLDEAENIINSAGAEITAEVTEEARLRQPKRKKKWWPFGR